MSEPQESDSSLLVVVLDVNASAWARSPLSLDKAVQQMVIFINAYLALNSENRLIVIGANHKECRYLFPSDPSGTPPTHDIQVYEQFRAVDVKVLSGVQSMIASEMDGEEQQSLISRALSMALCHIHRVSESSISKIWSRILVLSAGQDSPHSYIPLMNSIFAAQKMSVLIDICKVYGPDSVFLQQAAEITGGNYLKVDTNSEASLLQTLMFTCLPDQYTRGILNAPGNELIDFRATCFCHKRVIDIGYVVSMGQGLSTTVPSKNKDEQANESLFGDKERLNRRWQRKAVQGGTRTHTSTRIECAKSIVEQIVTHRHSYEHDRYMLVTYSASGRGCIRSTLRDSRQSMLAELRQVETTDRFYGGVALTTLFDQLALTRAAYDMDTYGYGRYPTLNEQTRIVWLTDGASIVTSSGVQNKLNLPVNNTPWVESYVEPFRWDQRMVMVLLHEQGDKELCNGKKNSSESALLPMCMVMGGSVHHVGSMHQAQRFVEGFAPSRAMLGQGRPQGSAMANSGVLVNFERIDDNPANPGNSDLRVLLHAAPCNVMNGPLPPLGADTGLGVSNSGRPAGNSAGMSAMINGHVGYFPIPEAFWPEVITPPQAQRTPGSSGWQIQRRSTHPTLGYSQTSTEWAVPAQFPFDKYQIDTSSSVAQKLLAAAQVQETQGRGAKPVCWPVFVNGSYTTPKNSGFPFGILRPNSARTAVNLFVLPYNFTALWKILGKLDAQVATQNTTRSAAAMQPAWRREFEEYLQHTPGYYAIPLKRAFNLYGIPHSVFPKAFGQSTGMRNITQYAVRTHSVARKEWDRVHAAEPAKRADTAGVQQELLQVDPALDVGRLVTNAFDVDRAHCLATLSAMRRVFVRELMSGQSARFSANTIIPPLLGSSTDADAMDVDGTRTPLSTPPLGSMEYSMFGYPQDKDLPHHTVLGRQSPHISGKSLVRDPDPASLGPGMQYSPLGGLVDVASEDDRDTRHSVPIRDMGEYGPAMHRMRASEARDPLLDERTAQMQRKNMFGNPYRRPLREPRGPLNNVLARNPELSAKLGLSRSSARPVVAPRVESDDDAGLEMESEAEVNELAVDKNFEDLPQSESGSDKGGRFWWMQRRNVPRRRSIAAPWRKNDLSWNVNPWNMADTGSPKAGDLAAITYTADSVIVNTHTAQIIRTASGTPVGSPRVASVSGAETDSQDVEPLAAISHPRALPGLGIVAAEARSQAPPTLMPSLLVEQTTDIAHDATPATALVTSAGDTSPMDIDTPAPATESVIEPAAEPVPAPKPTGYKVNVAEERAWFLRRIKADPAHYDEESVVRRLNELQNNTMLGKPQLKVIVMAAMTAAKAMRRKQLIPQLEQSLQN
ncbi:hypothetical protein GGH96_001455 [Coemansia sp. RSA 1972]|nr:hypothetical protein GGH96_001455 [Coemansia sp. RSA 1972]